LGEKHKKRRILFSVVIGLFVVFLICIYTNITGKIQNSIPEICKDIPDIQLPMTSELPCIALRPEPCGATLEDFKRIKVGMSIKKVEELLGVLPNRMIGSGRICWEYFIDDTLSAYIGFDLDGNIDGITVRNNKGNVLYSDHILWKLLLDPD